MNSSHLYNITLSKTMKQEENKHIFWLWFWFWLVILPKFKNVFNQTIQLSTQTWVVSLWAPSQYPKRRLSVRSRKVSKPRDLYLESSDRSEILQALRQQCCRCACQIAKWYDNLKYQSRGFETLRDLTKRRLFGYWDGALVVYHLTSAMNSLACSSPGKHCQN